MPYKLSENGLCVLKADTGEELKCYKTHAEALNYLQALEANVSDAKGISMNTQKAGARHSGMDQQHIQAAHDAIVKAGAMCDMNNSDGMMMPDMPMKAGDNYLKAVAESPYELVVQNKIVLFGGSDLVGERFTKATNLESKYTKSGRLLVDFEHGRDPDNIGNDKSQVLGYVDWKTATVTDEGVIVKRVLNRRHKYMKWLEPLIKAGIVGNSSEAIPTQVQKAPDGTILQWGLKRDTLTITPMEPRMITSNIVTALKALAQDFPEYKSLIPPVDSALSDADEQHKSKTLDPAQAGKEENKMDEQLINDAVQKAVSTALAVRDAEEKAKAEKAAADKALFDEAYKKGVEDAVKSRKAPNYNKIQKDTDKENENNGVAPFKHWMATGQENDELIRPDAVMLSIPSSKAAWNVTTGGSGGFLVPDPLYNQIIAKRNMASWIRQAPVQSFTTEADHLLVPRESTSHTSFTLTAEAGSYNEDEGTVSQKDLILYKYTKLTKINEEFLMYQTTNWESWFTQAMARAVAGTENTFATSGNGTGQPEGLSNGSTASGLTIKTSAQLNPEDLTALIGKLGAGYNVPSECGFVGANASKWYLKNAILAGPFAWGSNNGYNGAPDFFGYNYYVSDDVQSYTATSGVVLYFGNMSYFGVVEKPGMMIQRNPYLYMATGQVGIFCNIFRGSGVLQSEAIYSVNGK